MEAGSNQHFLCLYHSDAVGPLLLSRLLTRCGSFARLLQGDPGELGSLGLTRLQIRAILEAHCDERCVKVADEALAWAEFPDQHLLFFDSPDYPSLLGEIPAAPALLFIKGNLAALNDLSLAIVGSRKCSEYGKHNGSWFAAELGKLGLVICSGLARGIDTVAHRGALQVGGTSIAVLGTGIDVCYPKVNAPLAESICAQGALVSEFPLGLGPRPYQFPQRNRIISGLAVGALVVEADERSGSLITARLAMEQNREVFTIPGPIHSPQSRGCHRLLKQGAALVESPQELLATLAELGVVRQRLQRAAMTQVEPPFEVKAPAGKLKEIFELISHSGSIPDSLVAEAGMPWQDINAMLLELETLGCIYRRDGRVYPLAGGLHRPQD